MTKSLVRKIDPIQDSIKYLVVVSFMKSTSRAYPLAVNIAQGSAYHEEINVSNKLVHFVVFEKKREEAGRALSLINYVANWKGTQVFAGGKISQNIWKTTGILECFLEASACNDWTAHCYRIIDDPRNRGHEHWGPCLTVNVREGAEPLKEAIEIDRYIFPCKHLIARHFMFKIDHPAKFQDQIQAEAVSQGCAWCPNFDPSAYRKTGTRIIYKDLFE